MVAWLTVLRFMAIKNAVALTFVVPLSRALTKVCGTSPHWMPVCRKITHGYHDLQQKVLRKPSPDPITDKYAEDFGSKMITWTGISFGVGSILTAWHYKRKHAKRERKEKEKQDYIRSTAAKPIHTTRTTSAAASTSMKEKS